MTPATVSMPPPAPLRARLAVGTLLVVLLAALLVWSWDRADGGQPLGSVPMHEAVAAPAAPVPAGRVDPLERALAALADAQTLADPLGRTAATAEALSLLARDLAPRDPIDRLVRLQDLAGRHGLALSLEPAGSKPVAEAGPTTVDGGLGLRWRMAVPRDELAGAVDLVLLDLGVAGPVAAVPTERATATDRPAPTASDGGDVAAAPAAPSADLGGRGVALALAALLAGVLVVRRLNRADLRLRPSHVRTPPESSGRQDADTTAPLHGAPPARSAVEDAPPRLTVTPGSTPDASDAPDKSVMASPGDTRPEPWIVAFDPVVPDDGPPPAGIEAMDAADGRAASPPGSAVPAAATGEHSADPEPLAAPADPAGDAASDTAWRQVLDRLAAWTPPVTDGRPESRQPAAVATRPGAPAPVQDPPARETLSHMGADAELRPLAPTGEPSAVLELLGLAPLGREAARTAATLVPVDVAALLRQEVAAWEPVLPADAQMPELVPAVQPLLDLDPRAAVRAEADPQVLPIALRALLQQAVARAHRHVVASASVDDQHVQVRVDDDGGAAWRDADPDLGAALGFGGAMSGAGRNPDRLGLALAVVHRGARWHGGAATLEDSPLGGRRVTLRWPIRAGHDEPSGGHGAASTPAADRGTVERDGTPAAD